MSGTSGQVNGAAYGSGVYLAEESQTSFGYMQYTTGWKNSAIGSGNIGCLAMCEICKHPDLNGMPNPYWVVSNDKLISTRFFFVYPNSGSATAFGSKIKIMDVNEDKTLHSTADSIPYGITQFYGIPTLGWAGNFILNSTYTFNMREFYPPEELDRLSTFMTGQTAEYFNWTIEVTSKSGKLLGISGTFSAPIILDLIRPFIEAPRSQIIEFVNTYSSNRGNWPTDLELAILQSVSSATAVMLNWLLYFTIIIC